ncbi:MAG: hypothetical protein U0Z44_16910 [Kouleothrix sp.]
MVLLPYVVPMLRGWPATTRTCCARRIDTIYHSADVAEFLIPNQPARCGGAWATRQIAALTAPGIIATVVSTSYVLLALALAGVLARRRVVVFWLLAGAIFWVLALGPRLKWFGAHTDLPLYWRYSAQDRADHALPGALCDYHADLPGRAGGLRHWRAAGYARRQASGAPAYGAWGCRRAGAGARAWPAARFVRATRAHPSFYTDGTLAGAGALLEQPNPSNRGMFFQTQHQRPVLWGELSRDNPAGPLLSYLRAGPPPATPEIIDAPRTGSVLRPRSASRTWPATNPPSRCRRWPGATRVRSTPGAELFALSDPGPATTCLWLGPGWLPARRLDDGRPYRGTAPTARFALLRRTPAAVRLRLQLHCFAGPRHVQLRQGAAQLAELSACGWPPQPLEVPLDLPAGWSWFELTSTEPASNPADFGYPDTDPIAVGVSGFEAVPR